MTDILTLIKQFIITFLVMSATFAFVWLFVKIGYFILLLYSGGIEGW